MGYCPYICVLCEQDGFRNIEDNGWFAEGGADGKEVVSVHDIVDLRKVARKYSIDLDKVRVANGYELTPSVCLKCFVRYCNL